MKFKLLFTKKISYILVLTVTIFLFYTIGCKKDVNATLPILSTNEISNITEASAQSGGTIIKDGGANVTGRGVCWSITANPTIGLANKTSDGTGKDSFTSNITGLASGTTYHLRAYAKNSAGTAYGNDLTFSTLGALSTAVTLEATQIMSLTATLNGTINANYLSTVVAFEYGTTTNYGSTVTSTLSPITGNADTKDCANIVGLTAGTIYHYRIKGVNSLGTSYGDDKTFATLGGEPTAITSAATSIAPSTATLNGVVSSNAFETIVIFEYGLTNAYGSTITATQSPISANSTNVNVSAIITGLTECIGNYHFRVKAVSVGGTVYGSERGFTDPNIYAADYHCVGYRIRPGNPTEPVDATETLSTVNCKTVSKVGFGNYTAYNVYIEVKTDIIVVGGHNCYKVLATPYDPTTGNYVGGMYTTWTGDSSALPAPPASSTEINYYDPSTHTFVLNCYYNSASGNRIMYEVLTKI